MVKIEALQFGYSKGRPLFDNLNLTLDRGSIYGLFGVNGAGKTTLIRQIAGLLYPQSGTVSVNDRISSNRDVEMYQDLFVIPEEFFLPSIKMDKYVSLHCGLYSKFNHTVFESIISEFDLKGNPKLDAISHGQKKKFIIAFGIATQCSLLIMDEPTNGLDIPSKSQFRKVMASYINDEHCVLISTHQVRDLSSIIDQVIILDLGKIRFKETIQTITESFHFGMINDEIAEDILYSQEVFGGKAGIVKNHGRDSEIDFELLFNGVISESEKINNAIIRR